MSVILWPLSVYCACAFVLNKNFTKIPQKWSQTYSYFTITRTTHYCVSESCRQRRDACACLSAEERGVEVVKEVGVDIVEEVGLELAHSG